MSESGGPGWYGQPDGRERYWDGVEWTDQFRDPEVLRRPTLVDRYKEKIPVRSRATALKAAAIVAGFIALLGIGLAVNARSNTTGSTVASASSPSRFAAANSDCGNAWELRDNGRTLIGDGKGKEDATGISLDQLVCPLLKLHAPDSVVQHMDSTRALDGQQIDEWDGIKARWTYHPNAGFALTLVDSK